MKLKLPHSTQNWLSVIGAVIALISFFMIVFLFIVNVLFIEGSSYVGLVIYILLPGFLILGLLLIPIGMFFNRKKETTEENQWPAVDLNNLRHRNAFMIFSVGTTLFLLVSALGSYEAFHYTESVEFCGTLCHRVMEPEYTAYKHSAHARVACVDCHVGSGADWYMRSKLSGLYQVYSVLANKYSQPIETPIRNLRPARETCEECHWPQKFYARKLRLERHYLNDETNTEWDIRLIMKIGADHAALGLQEGIHWHINPDIKIQYLASDKQRQIIPWVRYINETADDTTIYLDSENPPDESLITTGKIQTMDCMDCHNRPSHSYQPPAFFVNNALTSGAIPKTLPEIKSVAMDICSEEFTTKDSAMSYIEETLKEFYQDSENIKDVEQAIQGLQEVYSRNIFPYMKVKWNAYPNNIGHLEFDGCFRCHNNTHSDNQGNVISKDCNLCHEIIEQGTPGTTLQSAITGQTLAFEHPVDIDDAWQEGLCTDCHTGLNP
jgi:hypothetical protein